MTRYKLIIEYDGSHSLGWQIQKNEASYLPHARHSIQYQIEKAIQAYCQENVTIQGSGRTDQGVHARGQVAHVDLNTTRDLHSILHGLNAHLQKTKITIVDVAKASDDFHARFDATQRYYLYRIINRSAPLRLEKGRAWHISRPLDLEAMQQAANLLVGTHDFSSFRASECQAHSALRSIDRFTVTAHQCATHTQEVHLAIIGSSFLHHQVRNMTGSLIWVGTGKWQLDDFAAAFAAKDRTQTGPTAPACGLYLTHVSYDTNLST